MKLQKTDFLLLWPVPCEYNYLESESTQRDTIVYTVSARIGQRNILIHIFSFLPITFFPASIFLACQPQTERLKLLVILPKGCCLAMEDDFWRWQKVWACPSPAWQANTAPKKRSGKEFILNSSVLRLENMKRSELYITIKVIVSVILDNYLQNVSFQHLLLLLFLYTWQQFCSMCPLF